MNAPASTRVRAADSVLDHAKHAIELEDVEARVTGLEQAAEAIVFASEPKPDSMKVVIQP